MNKLFVLSSGLARLVAVACCKQDRGGETAGAVKMNDSASATTPMVTTYTCTMHPEVTSDKPGSCPKCGMALVTKR